MKAVIDIGSNSVRLLIFNTTEDFARGVTDLDITRLGHDLNRTGKLSPEGIRATWEVFDRFQNEIRRQKVEQVEAFATEAVRKAADGEEFVAEINRRYGWNVRVIDGDEEAMIGFLGATSALSDGDWTLIDIGGASTEIIQGRDEITYQRSYPVGALRYTDDPELELANIFNDLPPAFGSLVGIGGTITTIMAMQLEMNQYQRHLIQAQRLSKASLEKWVNRLQEMSHQDRLEIAGLDPKREPIIVAGIKILHFLLEAFHQEWLVVSDYGNLEGYAISRQLCKKNSQ